MKTFIIIALMCFSVSLHAQLTIQNGASVSTTGGAAIFLQNIGLHNDGAINQAIGGKFTFFGDETDSISGAPDIEPSFDTLEIAKTNNGKLVLQQSIAIQSAVKFSGNTIDLSGNAIHLQPTALLLNESESSHITDTTSTGFISITQNLNAPSGANPGNLGAIISTNQDMGSTSIKRTHWKNVTNSGVAIPTVSRQFEIVPTNNSNLNATLQFQYLDAETNGLDESQFSFIKSETPPYTIFTNQGYSNRNTSANYIDKTEISDFSLWTLTGNNVPLSIGLSDFAADCVHGNINLSWAVENAATVNHFEIDYSSDGNKWAKISEVNPNLNNNHYQYTTTSQTGFYQLIMIKKDDEKEYSKIVKTSCVDFKDEVVAYPDPVERDLTVETNFDHNTQVNLLLYDEKGSLIKKTTELGESGINKYQMDLNDIMPGIYLLRILWNDGNDQKSLKIIKR